MKRLLCALMGLGLIAGLGSQAGASSTEPLSATGAGGVLQPLSASDTVDIEFTWNESGYWLLRADGRVTSRSGAPNRGDAVGNLRAGERAVSMSAVPGGGGYWIFTSQGRVLTYGSARHFGDMSGTPLNGPVLDSVATPTGNGYYMVASDGGVFAFGDARFYGSMGGQRLNGPVNGLAPAADNKGYWLVADDGGIFSFGSARFYGSMGGQRLNRPVVGMLGQGDGYLMVGADGGIFNYGRSVFHGSLGSNPPSSPVVAVASKRDLSGYRMVTAAGTVHSFGSAGPGSSSGSGFVETFDNNRGLDRFRWGVFHRDVDAQSHGSMAGSWSADHDVRQHDCGPPHTHSHTATKADRSSAIYVCRDHLMTSMGHVDGYSIVWFTPNMVFNGENTVSWDVNSTYLGTRQWWEVAIIPAGTPEVTCIDFLPCDTAVYAPGAVVVNIRDSHIRVWSDGSENTPSWQTICKSDQYSLDPEGCDSKAIRRPWSVTDNGNGTLTIRFRHHAATVAGSFPDGPFEVVFKDHSYTPDKDGPVDGYTWHWDNIRVE